MEQTDQTTNNDAAPSTSNLVEIKLDRQERNSRGLALITLIPLKLILIIPHAVILYFFGILTFFIVVIAQIVVLFTGKYPEGLFKIVKGFFQWQLRVNLYFAGLTDKYPPFTLNE